MNILADASLPGLNAAFPAPFTLQTYNTPKEIPTLIANQDILLCRSTLKINQALLGNHSLKYVATASSGTDHIDTEYLQTQNIKLIDAKGANADSVVDYVLSCLAYLFSQNLIKEKKLGIIGMGFVGTKLWQRLKDLEFSLIAYDPLKAIHDNEFESAAIEQLYECDILCLHAELHSDEPLPSANLINNAFLQKLKSHCIIINAARGGIVNETDLLAHKKIIYCTDVYNDEPKINKAIVERALLCTPHIAGHSLEAKFAAVALVSTKLHRILDIELPQFAIPEFSQPVSDLLGETWQELVLGIYNPEHETKKLKMATDLENTFLELRKAHQFRHDFANYFLI